jgi:hypothetical protein
MELQAGNYTIRVTAKDYSGNEAVNGKELEFVVGH